MNANDSKKGLIEEIRSDLTSSTLLPTIIAGLLSGVITITFMFSYSAVIFTGELTQFVPRATGHMLVGAIIISVIVGLFGQFRGVVALPQDNPTAIIAVMVVAMSGALGSAASPDALFIHATVIIFLSTICAGLLFIAIGRWQLGALVQHVPYPVIAGFLAGTGWLLFKGSFGVMADVPFEFGNLSALIKVTPLWLPGIIFALGVRYGSRLFPHPLTIPGLILGTTLGFHLILLLSGTSMQSATQNGWLLEPFGDGGLWQPINLDSLGSVEWTLIFSEVSGIGTILMIAIISVLLNLTALESVFGYDIDVNKEMRVTGYANILAALGGGLIGYHYVSLSNISKKMKADSKLVGVIVAFVCLLALTVGADALTYLPKLILGGLVLVAAFGFLDEWIVQSWSKLTRSNMAIIVVILATIEMIGFLEGVAVGIGVSVLIFIVNYSQVNVIRHAFSGNEIQSHIDRPPDHRSVLSTEGNQILLLKLQGFIFFSTTIDLVQKVEEALSRTSNSVSFILLDFQYVTGIDTSALHGFVKIKQKALEKGVQLGLVHVSPGIDHQFKAESFIDGNAVIDRMFEDADHALEWCENFLLRTAGYDPELGEQPLSEQLSQIFNNENDLNDFINYLSPVDFVRENFLFHASDTNHQLYIVESGELTVYIEKSEGDLFRLRRVGAGSLLGTAGFFQHDGSNSHLSVQADKPGKAFALSKDSFEKMKKENIALAAIFQTYILDFLSGQLSSNLSVIEILLRDKA